MLRDIKHCGAFLLLALSWGCADLPTPPVAARDRRHARQRPTPTRLRRQFSSPFFPRSPQGASSGNVLY